ncbi:integrating conjugative element protein PilL, PFGI-1 class [Legionella busanensis]|uniref:Integrating conjugative element protein PilL, PFGI-1 class n=1 Tax=Legionella busanensis TaxID=190655 RepID=A0A378JL48_9GAMM|nr:hypothetical protein [Legionella busanensis]STX50939.1 integrating conjugative element protein PilL, PFGI-1 class [Legionella busanensis]
MFKVFLLISFSLCALTAQTANVTQINRYTTVANKPLAAQVNPLLAIQQIRFSQDIKTIAEAINYWLQYSGYTLAPKEKQPAILQTVMGKKLPQIQRNLGPLSVREGLEILVGPQIFILSEDHIQREVNFKLKPAYQQTMKHPSKGEI